MLDGPVPETGGESGGPRVVRAAPVRVDSLPHHAVVVFEEGDEVVYGFLWPVVYEFDLILKG